MISSESTQSKEDILVHTKINNNMYNDKYESLQRKIETLVVDIEKQRSKSEEENKAKFLQLLEVVNSHLNENLVKGIENTIKREVKMGISQIRKNIADNIQQLEEINEQMNARIDSIEVRPSGPENLPASDAYVNAFKQVFLEEVLPVVESCFEELKLQLMDSNILKNSNNNESVDYTVSVKDEISNYLKKNQPTEAVLLAFDVDDSDLLFFLLEQLSNTNIEKLSVQLQYSLIQKGFYLYKEVKDEIILQSLYHLIMNIDINELNHGVIDELLLIFDELMKIEWPGQTNMVLIIKMQRKHATRRIIKNP